jgi:tellurite resistance protein TerC
VFGTISVLGPLRLDELGLGAAAIGAIWLGAALLERFHFTIYIFGAFLVLTGIRMALHRDEEMHPEKNPVLGLFRRVVPMTSQYHGQKFTVLEAGKRVATPLMAVLVLIETSDILFAVDSIPAIFAITDDPFIVFTSNAFAILGLRALYFMLAGMINRFIYLKIGLAVVLVYVGVKMLVSSWIHIPIWASLGFIALAITVSIVASLRSTKGDPGDGALPASHPDALGGSESTADTAANEPHAQPVEVPRSGDDGGVER